jgi:AbiV family abortive infection protein
MALSEETKKLAHVLIGGADKCFANADALHREASILANSGAWARGLLLHQISLEECAKVEMLAAAVTSLLQGEKTDIQRLYQAMTRHEAKNKANAYFLPVSQEELAARNAGDTAQAVNLFKEVQREFHRDSNLEKNASLYVNPGEPFTSPLDQFTEEDFLRVRKRNEEFLSLSYPKVVLLKKWESDLAGAAASIEGIFEALGLGALDRGNPESLKEFQASLLDRLKALAKSPNPSSGDTQPPDS